MKHVFFAFLGENVFVIGVLWINPKFNHSAWSMKTTWDVSASLTFSNVSNINNNHVWIFHHYD